MRLDKFLKVSRIIKRRTIANEVCSKGYISINGKTAKAALQLSGKTVYPAGTAQVCTL